jgi:hypothetical protein
MSTRGREQSSDRWEAVYVMRDVGTVVVETGDDRMKLRLA